MKSKLMMIVLLVMSFFPAYTQQNNNTFELEGSIELITTPEVFLLYSTGGKLVRDTSKIINGVFKFKGNINGPTYSQLWSSDYKYGTIIYLESNKMTVGLAGSDKHISVNGSATEDEYTALRQEYVMYNYKIGQLMQEVAALKNTDPAAAIKKETEEGTLLKTEMIGKIKFYIREHPKSYVSLQELTALSPGLDGKELLSFFEGLDKDIRESEQGKPLAQKIEAIKQTEVGKTAVNFVQKNKDGQEVSLQDFKGKYVLVDFWASWCGPCRVENPNVVKVWKKFKDKNFTILGVSLDENGDKWKDAIEKDKLNWPQVSDLKGWANAVALQYAVSSIPANFLIDPNGVIIAKNLRGDTLEQTLSEIFKAGK